MYFAELLHLADSTDPGRQAQLKDRGFGPKLIRAEFHKLRIQMPALVDLGIHHQASGAIVYPRDGGGPSNRVQHLGRNKPAAGRPKKEDPKPQPLAAQGIQNRLLIGQSFGF